MLKSKIISTMDSFMFELGAKPVYSRLLFLFLWLPVFQESVDRWVSLQNNSRKRRDHRISLPTACTPEFLYGTPESFDTTDQLLHIPANDIEGLLQQD
jgi:hypothetical protein